ncbi:conserved hypothetical protein [Hymenobacter gelipurpurascens]|uniref:DUF4440 domain-containing protein n=1 Tax=Hymenobacter gelipurpurascens TaxID=89968 RepID=A0A212THU3_9BACT|nr:nuclear transport factor 2 family protein [Hymenobacter gelipurpurascens]SNC65450.1 conserved hypothetical protein [Hymenobacter gelipurpurascens]
MSTQPETLAAEHLLTQYAQALNSADTAALASFYTPDGVFMPEGLTTLPVSELLARAEAFFAKEEFQIDFAVESVAVDGAYCFVRATASTRSTERATQRELGRRSRDFFVLRQQPQGWKIFCYIFNSVQAA